ncbi:MAG: hypothetical protein ACE5IZ_03640 [Dehalococcoidia bacterium]
MIGSKRPARDEAKAGPTLSPRLQAFLEELVQGRAPSVGRFCGHCYTPLPTGRRHCDYCGHTIAETPPLQRLPQPVIDVFKAQRRWEGTAVRLAFYSVLFLGIFVSALLMALLPFWWNVGAFMGGLAVSYVVSANIANTLGDALGYRWGQRAARRKWQQSTDKQDPVADR